MDFNVGAGVDKGYSCFEILKSEIHTKRNPPSLIGGIVSRPQGSCNLKARIYYLIVRGRPKRPSY